MDEVIVVVKLGMVSEVYSTTQNVIVSVIDMDTDDANKMESLKEEQKELKARVDARELYEIL